MQRDPAFRPNGTVIHCNFFTVTLSALQEMRRLCTNIISFVDASIVKLDITKENNYITMRHPNTDLCIKPMN